ncbi:ribosomal protein-related [Abeliophyllum distichum]|uniref:Ribosomal protein-related n=1 Tax=Abeliophyllum distichum TaxID=126358 RepID=A0ABD1RT89_9LAMI
MSPPQPSPPSQSQAGNEDASGKKKNRRRLPSPRELVEHYEKEGMDTQEASFKVIQDLQNAVFRMITSTQSKKKGNSDSDVTSKKLDVIHSRLLQLEMKLDSKPGYPQAVAVGVASAGIWNAAVQIWNSVSRASSSFSNA